MMNNKEFESLLHNIKHGHFVQLVGVGMTSKQWRMLSDAVIDVSISKKPIDCAEYIRQLATRVCA